MKITTWNVNGFRAVIQKDFHRSVEMLDPDVLCLQEIKAREEQVPEELRSLDGYTGYWNPATRPGYSGVASYVRNYQPEILKGLGLERFDGEGRVIQMDFGRFVLFNIYFPNGQRGQERLDYKLEFYEELLRLINEMRKEKKYAIVTGDFNTAHNEIDLKNPKENETTSGFLPEERAMIDVYLQNHLKDVYRELYPERVQYTWWTYRMNARARGIGWRLDYFLVSDELFEAARDVIIHNEVMGSDHCPVTLILDETKVN
jgi:exodeoxyribonuclease-3